MSNNREVRTPTDSVHILMGLKRVKFEPNSKKQCIRIVVKDYEADLASLEAKLKYLGGEWRIHRTVNARDVKKACKVLMHRLIDDEKIAGYVDSEWRTALLQRQCIFGEKKFMLDIDTQEEEKVAEIERILDGKATILERIKSPKGWHYVTLPFDVREVCKLDYVCLQRDGYVYVKTVGKADKVEENI